MIYVIAAFLKQINAFSRFTLFFFCAEIPYYCKFKNYNKKHPCTISTLTLYQKANVYVLTTLFATRKQLPEAVKATKTNRKKCLLKSYEVFKMTIK